MKPDIVDRRAVAMSRMRIGVHLVRARVVVDERHARAGRHGDARGLTPAAVMVIVVVATGGRSPADHLPSAAGVDGGCRLLAAARPSTMPRE